MAKIEKGRSESRLELDLGYRDDSVDHPRSRVTASVCQRLERRP